MPTIEEDLRFLITELQEECTNTGDELASCPIPGTFGEAWDLFRALCNTRLPEHVSGEFLAKQDKLLHAIIDEEGSPTRGSSPRARATHASPCGAGTSSRWRQTPS